MVLMRDAEHINCFGQFFSFLGERGGVTVGTIMAMGMMGSLGVVLGHLNKQQSIIKKKTEIYFELDNLSNRILGSLYDGNGCLETLGLGTDIIDGGALTAIKDKEGKVVVDTSQDYGNQLIKVHSINISNVKIEGNSGQMDLEVIFKKLSRSIGGNKKIVQSYPLSLEVDDLKRLTKCHYNYGNVVSLSAEGVCKSLGGAFDPVTLECALKELAFDIEVEACKNMGLKFDNTANSCVMDNIVREIQKKSCESMGGMFETFSGKCNNIRR